MTEARQAHRVGYTVNGVVSLAVRWLPAADRDRYDTEFRSEVYFTSPWRRLDASLSMLWGSIALGRELRLREAARGRVARRRGVRCRLGMHHDERKYPVPRQGGFEFWFECTRCGRFKDGPSDIGREVPGHIDMGI